ncbi:MAG: response regulator [Variovorax sp.]
MATDTGRTFVVSGLLDADQCKVSTLFAGGEIVSASGKDAVHPFKERTDGAGGQRLRVLVVEDDRDALEATLETLELMGHWATGVQSAERALDRFTEGAFDVLMADIGLPALSGLDLAKKLRERCKLPVIFASGQSEPDAPLPGTVWLSKPFSFEQLGDALYTASRLLDGASSSLSSVMKTKKSLPSEEAGDTKTNGGRSAAKLNDQA